MNVFWLLMLTGVVALLQMCLFRVMGQKHLHYSRSFSADRVRIGEPLEMVEDITSLQWLPVPWVRAESRIPAALSFTSQKDLNIEDDFFHRSVFSIMPYRHIRRRYRVTCTHRGYFDLSSVTLTTGDLLGLYSAHRTLDLGLHLLVYPKLLPFSVLDITSREWQGDVAVRRWIQPDPFLVNGIRDYRLGDNPRDIHAGATARTGSLQIKTHDYTASPRIMILLNAQRDANQWSLLTAREREGLEGIISLAATMVAWCRSNRVPCGFACNGVLTGAEKADILLTPSAAPGQYEACMESLARLMMQRRIRFPLLLSQVGAALPTEPVDIVALSCYWDEEIEAQAQLLRAMGHSVTYRQVHPQEVEL